MKRLKDLPIVALAALALAGATATVAQVSFTEVGLDIGIGSATYKGKGQHNLGISWIDADNDGWPDLFLVNGVNRRAHFFWNDGDGTFTSDDSILPELTEYELMGSIFADYDRDGDADIYIFTDHEDKSPNSQTNPRDGPPNFLLKNLWVENGQTVIAGQPLFEEVAAAAGVDDLAAVPFGVDYPGYRSSVGGWIDYDRDGWIDLYVGHWTCQAGGEPANADRLYRNNGDGTFEDVTAAAGIHNGADPDQLRPALGFIAAHLDDDLWPDILVANTADPPPHHHDQYYRNNRNGTFTDVTALSPGFGDDSGAAMGITVGDPDLDGDWDLYISDLFFPPGGDADPRGNPLYLGNGDGTFADNSADVSGVEAHNSWGVNFFDADQDGYEDLFVGTMETSPVHNYFYLNNQDMTFSEITVAAGLEDPGEVRGTSLADYDRDGDLDLAASYEPERLRLFRNDTLNAGHWLQLKLNGVVSNLDAIGAIVHVVAGDLDMRRQVLGGDSAHSQGMLDVHFGLGDATVVDLIEVFWPSGAVNTFANVAADQHLEITEVAIPCQDLRPFLTRCTTGGALQYRVSMLDTSHDGEIVTVDIDGELHRNTIFNGRAQMSIFNQGGTGQRTVTLAGPLNCQPPVVVDCGSTTPIAND